MKKLIVLSLAALLCLPLAGYAASIGGAETQGQGKWSIGLDEEYVFDRDAKDKTLGEAETYSYTGTFISDGAPIDVDIAGIEGAGKYKSEIDRMSRSMIKLNYGLLDNLDVFAKLGEANFKWKVKGGAPDSGIFSDPISGNSGTYEGVVEHTGTFKGKSAFAWGLGMNGVYPLENGWFLGMQAQYLRHKNTLKCSMAEKARGNYEITAGPDTGEKGTYEKGEENGSWTAKATVQEWQIAPYVAYKIENFTPYLGVKYSDQRIKYKNEGNKTKIKADDNFGVFVGTDYKLAENWTLNLEGRFVDETAMSVGTTYKF